MSYAHNTVANDVPQVDQGSIERIANFPSQWVAKRHIDVWLPLGYDKQKKYAALYMHDGSMLFDAGQTWNQQEWKVDEVASRLMSAQRVRDFIVIGIHNGGKLRHSEYTPEKIFLLLNEQQQSEIYASTRSDGAKLFAAPIQSDNYLKFLVHELKPYIDSHYSVHSDRANTFIMGSSMGGLISLYAISEYPEVFAAAACLSTHWTGIMSVENNPVPSAIYRYLKKMLPEPQTHRIYFDHGTETLDAWYPPFQKEIDKIMAMRGYSESSGNWRTRVFQGAKHEEKAWAERLAIPLQFLLGHHSQLLNDTSQGHDLIGSPVKTAR